MNERPLPKNDEGGVNVVDWVGMEQSQVSIDFSSTVRMVIHGKHFGPLLKEARYQQPDSTPPGERSTACNERHRIVRSVRRRGSRRDRSLQLGHAEVSLVEGAARSRGDPVRPRGTRRNSVPVQRSRWPGSARATSRGRRVPTLRRPAHHARHAAGLDAGLDACPFG